MFFLLNDVVLQLGPTALTPPLTAQRFSSLSFDAVRELGQELFCEHPRLSHTHPERAARLATLLLAKSERINAALFVSPCVDCRPDEVAVRFCEVDYMVMVSLHERQRLGRMTPIVADNEVWRRLAA